MKNLILLLFISSSILSCDSKKESIIDSQKMINKRITGLTDSLQRVSDPESFNRIKSEIRVEQLRFDSLSNELNKLNH